MTTTSESKSSQFFKYQYLTLSCRSKPSGRLPVCSRRTSLVRRRTVVHERTLSNFVQPVRKIPQPVEQEGKEYFKESERVKMYYVVKYFIRRDTKGNPYFRILWERKVNSQSNVEVYVIE